MPKNSGGSVKVRLDEDGSRRFRFRIEVRFFPEGRGRRSRDDAVLRALGSMSSPLILLRRCRRENNKVTQLGSSAAAAVAAAVAATVAATLREFLGILSGEPGGTQHPK